MKVLLIVWIIILLILVTNIRIKFYKVNNEDIKIYIIIFKLLPIKFKIKKLSVNSLINESITNIVSQGRDAIRYNREHKELIKKFLKAFNAKTIFLSINSFYYIYNINLYLATFYLYSFLQNLLYINLNKINRSCFKSRVKTQNAKVEIDIDLETRIYKLLLIVIMNFKEIISSVKEFKNEQSSNNRIIENINGKY